MKTPYKIRITQNILKCIYPNFILCNYKPPNCIELPPISEKLAMNFTSCARTEQNI